MMAFSTKFVSVEKRKLSHVRAKTHHQFLVTYHCNSTSILPTKNTIVYIYTIGVFNVYCIVIFTVNALVREA